MVDLDDPWYEPFSTSFGSPSPSESTIDVEVLAVPSPPSDSPQFFEADGEWMMQPEGDGYRISLFHDEAGRFTMVARSDALTSRVKVYAPGQITSAPSAPAQLTNPVHYPLDQLLLMNHLASRGGMIVHAAGAVVGGKALVFPGVSGAGKSTLCRLLVAAGLGDLLLSDDRVILRRDLERTASSVSPATQDSEWVETWGTPWPGDARIARNAGAPLAAVLFLVKADRNEVVPLSPGLAMRRLMPVVSCPWYDRERGSLVLDTCGRIAQSFPCYDLRFRPEGDVVALLTGRSWDPSGRRRQGPVFSPA